MTSIFVFNLIRTERELQGWSQDQLSRKSKISLPMLQLIEARKANPSLKVLERLCNALQLKIQFAPTLSVTERLVVLMGVVQSSSRKRITLKPPLLRKWTQEAFREQKQSPKILDERIRDAFNGLLLAIYEYYPTFFKSLEITPPPIDEKTIKLKRIALPQVVEVLSS